MSRAPTTRKSKPGEMKMLGFCRSGVGWGRCRRPSAAASSVRTTVVPTATIRLRSATARLNGVGSPGRNGVAFAVQTHFVDALDAQRRERAETDVEGDAGDFDPVGMRVVRGWLA